MEIIAQGAEATIKKDNNIILKERISKSYRNSIIDQDLRKRRTKKEAKILEDLQNIIPVPKILEKDLDKAIIKMEFIKGLKLAEHLENLDHDVIAKNIGENIAKIHNNNIIHGDLTTSNMILKENKLYFIDFGLSTNSNKIEDKAVDLHLLKQALESKHYTIFNSLFKTILNIYKEDAKDSKEILQRLEIVEKRGRHKH